MLLLKEVLMRAQVRKIGNSLGNIIPATLLRQLNLTEGAPISLSIENGKIIIEPFRDSQKRFPFSEQELMLGLDAHTGHTDNLATLSGK
ncbi:AbrB/MazE/SpoVT family DNA-binding domain-containing protein [Reinekea sp.]|jgi:antitoxin MazE|uniref:AbrB/MazE/SpoVT family DNA-binding domain-containing protein n=1 Tax=Reinekea sp. TaxID=1970455 RepID=UPI002A827248|nr:AbrB/MazE/SpoVT family DNA-binding domain-containing protein [Reinekea sp.]